MNTLLSRAGHLLANNNTLTLYRKALVLLDVSLALLTDPQAGWNTLVLLFHGAADCLCNVKAAAKSSLLCGSVCVASYQWRQTEHTTKITGVMTVVAAIYTHDSSVVCLSRPSYMCTGMPCKQDSPNSITKVTSGSTV